jgi:hypothetical protein
MFSKQQEQTRTEVRNYQNERKTYLDTRRSSTVFCYIFSTYM